MHRFSSRSVGRLPAGVVVGGAVLLAGCIGGEPACETLPAEIEMTLTSDTLTPSDPAVCRGAELTMTVRSAGAGVFHIHGYDAQAPAANVASGEVLELSFSAERSGQFPIEVHLADDAQGVDVGAFTVHEP